MADESFKFQNLLTSVSTPDTSGKNLGTERAESKITAIYFTAPESPKKPWRLQIYPWPPESGVLNSPLVKLNFIESMFAGPMFGNIVLRDINNSIDSYQFIGTEKLHIEFDVGKNEPNNIKLTFDVYSRELLTDLANNENNDSNDEKVVYYNLNFIGNNILDAEFYGSGKEEFDYRPRYAHDYIKYLLTSNGLTFDPERIDNSKTGVWYKPNVSYPWMRPGGRINFLQLTKTITNYSIAENEYFYPSFYTWEDRRGWSFKNIKPLKQKDPVDGFIITPDQTNTNGIIKFEVIKDIDQMQMLNSGALGHTVPIDAGGSSIEEALYAKTNLRDIPNAYSGFFTDNNPDDGSFSLHFDPYSDFDFAIEEVNLPDSYNINIGKDKEFFGTQNAYIDLYGPDTNVFGYMGNFLNTPDDKIQEWDYYSFDTNGPWYKNSFVPPFDITALPFDDFLKIYKIRETLQENRYFYARAKNVKRAWEIYRCTMCCHEYGALGSKQDIELLKNPGPITGITYQDLFGPDGVYSTNQTEYKILAAGSFTDTLNYDPGNTFNEHGLTYSYDLTKAPYNESIGQFFNLKGPSGPLEYTKYVIDRSIGFYNILLTKIDKRLDDIQNFLGKVESYKDTADNIFAQALIDKESTTHRPIDLSQGFRYVGDSFPGENIGPFIGSQVKEWPISEQEYALVPYTAIPPNKGVGVVIFGEDPNQGQVQFRFAEGNFAGEAYGVCIGRGSPCNCFTITIEGIENCVDGGGTPWDGSGNGVYDCSNVTPIMEISSGCFRDYTYCTPSQSCIPASSGQQSYSAIYNTSAECEANCGNGGGGGLVKCCNSGSCSDVPVSDCPLGSQVSSCCDCDSFCADNPNHPDCISCGGEGDYSCPPGQIRCCLPGICFCKTPQECFEQGGSQPENNDCTLCTGGGGGGGGGTPGPRGPTGPTGPTGPSGLPTEEDIRYINPDLLRPCSTDPVIRGYIKYITESSAASYSPIYDYAAPYLWDDEDQTLVRDWSFYDYGSESGLIPGISDPVVITTTKNCLRQGGCYNTTCLSANALESLRRTVTAERQLLSVEKELVTRLRDEVVSNFRSKWNTAYTNWYQRNAFFFSKKPGASVFRNEETETQINSPLSLFNIKKITRKEIRGSRYELLSKYVGITGASAGQWLYDIYFGGDSGSTAHPYYDQKYNEVGFVTSRAPHAWFGFADSDATDDPAYYKDFRSFNERPYGPQYKGNEYKEPGLVHINAYTNNGNNFIQGSAETQYGYAQHDLRADTSGYKQTFNFYNVANKKPPNIKKEEISSYVRIDFAVPIGLDRVKDFPNGFIRDAGVEYFLPYIVNLTPGPFGRQGVKYNIAVIGMDPYGFDVAVKKIKDDLPTNRKLQGIDKGNYYKWWNHDTGMVLSKSEYLTTDYNGMDLWPEDNVFETEYPYYAYDASQEDLHGGGYDMDFHMGGGYYFENDSQDWMESLYQYGVSSGKQFDPLYRTSVLGSYILPNSYRKLKPHRSWWSLFVPRNLFVPIRFSNMLKSPNTKARDMFGGRAIFTINPNYWRTWYGSEFETWLSLENNGAVRNLISGNAPDLKFYIESVEGDSISPVKNNGVQTYFHDSLMNYLSGNNVLWNSTIVTTDLWKYDLSGETEYGIVTPPVDTEYEFFDRNFAAQFTVFGRPFQTCEDLGLKCSDKTLQTPVEEFVGTCPKNEKLSSPAKKLGPADEYCNCPNYLLNPTNQKLYFGDYGFKTFVEPLSGPTKDKMNVDFEYEIDSSAVNAREPTYLELHRMKKEIEECRFIEYFFGKKWLGCDYAHPDATWNCTCSGGWKYDDDYEVVPDDQFGGVIGDPLPSGFGEETRGDVSLYSLYQRTYATFWGISQDIASERLVYDASLKTQQVKITIPPNDKVNVGDLVELLLPRDDISPDKRQFRTYSGKWMIASIEHEFVGQFKYVMHLTLVRDSSHYPVERYRYDYNEKYD